MKIKKIIFMITIIIACILIYSVNSYAVSTYIEGENKVEIGSNIQLEAYEELLVTGTNEPHEKICITELARWQSSDPSIATVDKGIVTGIAEGTVTITARIDIEGPTMPEASFEITVVPDSYSKPIYYLEVMGEAWIPVRETVQLQAKSWEQEGIFETGKQEPVEIKNEKKNEANVTNQVTWTSSNPEVAIVDDNGIVKGIKEGIVKIVANYTINNLELKAEHTIEVKGGDSPTQPPPSNQQQPSSQQKPEITEDSTTTKKDIPKTGIYGNLILAITLAITVISFAIYNKYKNIE